MFGCHRPDPVLQQENGEASNSPEGLRTVGSSWSKSKALLVSGAIAVAPHALCILGLGGLVGVGGFSVHQLCGHHDRDADSSRGIEIRRLEKVPSDYTQFPELRAAIAREALIAAEPRFAEIIEAKRAESEGKPIQVVFLESGENVHVVVCKEGALCPCSKPQVYDIGTRNDIAGEEKFRGQHAVLRSLYGALNYGSREELCAPPGYFIDK